MGGRNCLSRTWRSEVQQEEYTRKQETALNQLAEMGFADRNKKLLEQSRNDVAAVVERLSQDASAAQRRS